MVVEEIYPYNIIDFNNEKLLLVEPKGELLTYMVECEETFQEIDKECKVFATQTWVVDVLGEIPFGKSYTCTRKIEFYYGKFKDIIKKTYKLDLSNNVDYNNLYDDLSNAY